MRRYRTGRTEARSGFHHSPLPCWCSERHPKFIAGRERIYEGMRWPGYRRARLMSATSQKRRFDPLPATSGLPRSTDINRPVQLVRLVPMIGIGGSLSAPPLPHHRAGPYTAVREVALTRFDQGWETERFEVGVGKPNRKGLAPGDVPGATAAAGRIAQFPRDSQCDQCRTTATWCFPLTPQSGPQSQPDPASESDQHLGRFAKAEIAAPAPHIRDQFFHCRLDADALGPFA